MKKMIVLTAPSGAGKSSIAGALMKTMPFLEFSISATTRKPRAHESHGVHYYFLSTEEFTQGIASDKFAEFEEVYENQYYGTLREEIDRIWARQMIVLFDVDVRGAATLKQRYGAQCLALFIKAPSMKVLESRLRHRKSETEESLQKRLNRASYELSYKDRFDYTIVNDTLDKAVQKAKEVILDYLNLTDL